ncbi:MAG: TonB-dependent receptor [Opitutales bacterium]|nr:TonB-dependent receptor [Opitutales bacterium]
MLFSASQAYSQDAAGGAQEEQSKYITLDTLVVEAPPIEQSEQQIGSQSVALYKITDLSELIAAELAEATMVRKSGYGNEVNLRGFSQANLPVLVNGGFIEGACGSRKDPALSHINLLTVDRIVVREGPFDVSRSGNLGGYVDVITREPQERFTGQLLARIGSYDFASAGFSSSMGTEAVQALLGYNYSQSGQYEDGDGVALWQLREGRSAAYNNKGKKADAFSKNDLWGAVKARTGAKGELLVEYAYGEARDILTSRVEMDTAKETTGLARAEWTLRELGPWSEELLVRAYYNDVGHYPTQRYREVAVPKKVRAKTSIMGGAVENKARVAGTALSIGADAFEKDWEADVFNETTGALLNGILVPSVNEAHIGAFARSDSEFDGWTLSAGIRVDRVRTRADEALTHSAKISNANRRTDTMTGGFVSLRRQINGSVDAFAGVGRSYRTPTGVERYIQSGAAYFGNPELEPVSNTEADLGLRLHAGRWSLQVKGFYSDLEDYIYQVLTDEGWKSYENIDAHIYGADAKAGVELGSGFSLNAGAALQRGRKDSLPSNNEDWDLGQMAPFKGSVALDYQGQHSIAGRYLRLFGSIGLVHGDKCERIDSDAGETLLDSWNVVNMRVGVSAGSWTFVAGVDNLFDQTYALANSYEWDVLAGASAQPLVVNEPGRFVYASISRQW